jgi:hypothetical protein
MTDPTLGPRRASRFAYAKRRIERMLAAEPRFTREQLKQLAKLVLSGVSDASE